MSCLLNAFLLVQFTSFVTTTQGPPLIFIPSGNIALGQNAVFQCAVESTSIGITWMIDNKIITNSDVVNRIAYRSGVGKPNSTLALKGTKANNNTLVTCTASGLFSGSPYSTSFCAMVKIQGLLDSVQNLTSIISCDCCLHITWTPPFSLSGVPILGFNLNLSLPTGKEVVIESLSSSSYGLCPESTLGEYAVTVAGLNAVGQGMATSINFSTGGIVNGSLYQLNPEKLLVSCTFDEDTRLSPVQGCYILVNCTDHNFQYDIHLVYNNTTTVTEEIDVSFPCSANAYFYNIECNNTILLHKPAIVVQGGISIEENRGSSQLALDSQMSTPTTTTDLGSTSAVIFGIVSIAAVTVSSLMAVIICLVVVLVYQCWKKGRGTVHREAENKQNEVSPQAGTTAHGTNPLAMLPATAQMALYLELHAKEIDPLLTHKQLMCFLAFPSVANKWYEIGILLHLPPSQLKEISLHHHDDISCMSEIFKEWMVRETIPFTWEVVLQVLMSDAIGEYELAHHLQVNLQQVWAYQHSNATTPSCQGGTRRSMISDAVFVENPEDYENLKASSITTNRSIAYRLPK